MALGAGFNEAEAMVKKLLESRLVERAAIAGSTRRMRETVGDLEISGHLNQGREGHGLHNEDARGR